MEAKDLGKTSIGMQPNLAAMLSYLLGVFTGIVFYLIEKENKFVRFHAMQSILAFGFLFAIGIVGSFIPVLGMLVIPVLWLVEMVIWIVLMVKAYQGEWFKLPIVGDMAEKNS